MIPVHIKKVDGPQPPNETHYVVARNGIFLRKKMGWVDAVVSLPQIPLENEETWANLLLPPLPGEILLQSLKLAKAVFDISQSEVCLLLHHGEAGYKLSVPQQSVDVCSIDYDSTERLPNMLCVGTIHSHARFGAHHSEVDREDEENTDGIHITLGRLDHYPHFELSAEMAINGNRFPVPNRWFANIARADEWVRIYDVVDPGPVPKEWLKNIKHLPV